MKTSRSNQKTFVGLWVLATGLILYVAHSAWIGSEAYTTVHIPLAHALQESLGTHGQGSGRVHILAGDLGDESGPWKTNEPLDAREWQRVFDRLADSEAGSIHILQAFTSQEAAALKPDVLGNRAFFATFPSPFAPVEGSLSTGTIQGLNPFGAGVSAEGESPVQSSAHLQGPHAKFGQSVRYGHWGPWSANAAWPHFQTDSEGEWKNSRHVLLAGLPSLRIEGGSLVTPSGSVSLISRQRIAVLPFTRFELEQSLNSLRSFLDDPEPFLSTIAADDLVIVQERKLSPESPSFRAELAQSAGLARMMIEGPWLRNMPGADLILVLNALATLLCAFMLRPRRFLWVSSLALGAQILAAPFVLLEYGYLTPWSHLAFVVTPAALIGAFVGTIRQSIDEKVLVQDLLPAFASAEAADIARKLDPNEDASVEKLVSILDVNVVGFAKTIENTLPEETPHQISTFLESLIEIVHEHDGFVSDHSPDRILAIFGHGLTKKDRAKSRSHVSRALSCAEQVQKKSVELMHDLGAGVMPPFPVRCGVNSSTVRLGLLKLRDRIEYRAIGAGVDLASRLAYQCEAFRILISDSSHELLSKENLQKEGEGLRTATERSLRLTDSLEWCRAYEIDPFAGERDTLKQALELYRSYNNIKREDNRFAFPRGAEPILESEHGSFDVLDFSFTGLRLRSKRFIAAGSVLTAWPAEYDESNAPYKFTVTVHWGSPDRSSKMEQDVYVLGVRYLDSSESELAAIASYFHERFAASVDGVAPETAGSREVG